MSNTKEKEKKNSRELRWGKEKKKNDETRDTIETGER